MKKIGLFFILGFFTLGCTSDDDICMSGEATPRMKIKFRDTQNRAYRIPQINIKVDYGDGKIGILEATNVDSVLVPLRIDESTFTNFSVSKSEQVTPSNIQVSYKTKTEYVSPACGMKRIYENVSTNLQSTTTVKEIQSVHNEIKNEEQTHFYFIFDPS